MKKIVLVVMLISNFVTSSLAYGRGGPSEASAASIVVTGSFILVLSTLPLIALDSIFGCSVAQVKPAGNKMTDIEIREKNSQKLAVIRVPDQALTEITIKTGQKADFIADANGHTLQIEGRPVAYIPGKSADGLIHSKALK
ncbi:MAG: hypothetical protein V4623_04760 [Pseudomonadota bacterium]